VPYLDISKRSLREALPLFLLSSPSPWKERGTEGVRMDDKLINIMNSCRIILYY